MLRIMDEGLGMRHQAKNSARRIAERGYGIGGTVWVPRKLRGYVPVLVRVLHYYVPTVP